MAPSQIVLSSKLSTVVVKQARVHHGLSLQYLGKSIFVLIIVNLEADPLSIPLLHFLRFHSSKIELERLSKLRVLPPLWHHDVFSYDLNKWVPRVLFDQIKIENLPFNLLDEVYDNFKDLLIILLVGLYPLLGNFLYSAGGWRYCLNFEVRLLWFEQAECS